jgi:hypothetical protein
MPVWPVVLAELIRVLSETKDSEQDYGVASAALKVVAVASMMELEEFHMHRWMFVQDAVHASVAPPLDSDEAPQASAMFQPYSVRFLQQAAANEPTEPPLRTSRSAQEVFLETARVLNDATPLDLANKRKNTDERALLDLLEADFVDDATKDDQRWRTQAYDIAGLIVRKQLAL